MDLVQRYNPNVYNSNVGVSGAHDSDTPSAPSKKTPSTPADEVTTTTSSTVSPDAATSVSASTPASTSSSSSSLILKKNPLLSLTARCGVCGEPAAKHVHYGAISCFSCRAFFRRSVQNDGGGRKRDYRCKHRGSCEITLRTRKSCQKCRLEKCFAVGMRADMVLTEEQRHKRFRKVREKKKQLLLDKDDNQDEDEVGEGEDDQEDQDELNRAGSSPPWHAAGQGSETEGWGNGEQTWRSPTSPAVESSHGSWRGSEPPDSATSSFSGQSWSETSPNEHIPISSLSCSGGSSAHVSCPAISYISEAPEPLPGRGWASYLEDGTRYYSHYYTSGELEQPQPFLFERSSSIEERPPLQRGRIDEVGMAVLRLHPERNNSSIIAHPLLMEPVVEITEGELATLRQVVGLHDAAYKSVPFGEELIRDMVTCSAFNQPMKASAAIAAYRVMIQRVTRVAQSLDLFEGLSVATQAKLLKQNADLLVNLRAAIFFEEKKKGLDQIVISLGVDDVVQAKSIIYPLVKSRGLQHIRYSSFNSLQKPTDSDSENRYHQLLVRVGETLGEEPELVALLSFVTLFRDDGVGGEGDDSEESAVREAARTATRMLRRFVLSRFGRRNAASCTNAIESRIADLREMAAIKRQRPLVESVGSEEQGENT